MHPFKFDIAGGSIESQADSLVVSKKVVRMNSGVILFRVVLINGFDIIVKAEVPMYISGEPATAGVNMIPKTQDVFIFNKSFTQQYKGFFDFTFVPYRYSKFEACFNIMVESWGASTTDLCKLRLTQSGYFCNDELLECENMRKFFTRAAVLR